MRRSARRAAAVAATVLARLVLLSLPTLARAQAPATSGITIQSIRMDPSVPTLMTYTRSGRKPTDYRTAGTPDFTGAPWTPFTEGATTATTIGTTTWITGAMRVSAVGVSGDCGANTVKMKRYFQFRVAEPTQRSASVSNVAADSVCVPFG